MRKGAFPPLLSALFLLTATPRAEEAPVFEGVTELDMGASHFSNIDALAAAPGNGVYALAFGSDDLLSGVLFRLDAQGQVLWRQALEGRYASGLAADSAGTLYVLRTGIEGDLIESRRGTDGALMDQSPLPGNMLAVNIVFGDPPSRKDLYVSGTTYGDTPGDDQMTLLALDPVSLAVTREIHSPLPADTGFPLIGVDVDAGGGMYQGAVLISGSYRLTKYAPGLESVAWNASQAADIAYSSEAGFQTDVEGRADPRGGYVFMGSEGTDAPFSLMLRPVSSSGAFQAAVSLGRDSFFNLMGIDRKGNIYTRTAAINGFAKLNPSGQVLWNLAVNRASNTARLLPVGGRLHVGGSGWDGRSQAFVTRYRQEEGPMTLSKVNTSTQPVVAVVGSTAPALAVRVDADGEPLEGAAVNFTITASTPNATGMGVSPASTTTNAAGLASTVPTLGDLPFEYQVTAACPDCAVEQSSATFTCCAKLPATDYKQAGILAPWQGETYDSTTDTIGRKGCALASLANLNNFYAASDERITPQTPETLNSTMTALGRLGYTPGGAVVWKSIEFFTSSTITLSGFHQIHLPPQRPIPLEGLIDLVKTDVLQKRPVIVGMSGEDFRSHYMLVVGLCGEKFVVHDPGSSISPRLLYDPRNLDELLVTVVRFRHNP